MRKVGGNVVGTALNMVDVKRLSAYSYSYYYYGSDDGQGETGRAAAAS